MIGDTGQKLHTGRSRNDQVATALRLWLREAIDELIIVLRDTQRSLVELAEKHQAAVLPAYTHLKRAQPVLSLIGVLPILRCLRATQAALPRPRPA